MAGETTTFDEANTIAPSARVAEPASGRSTACVTTLRRAFTGEDQPEDALHFKVGDPVRICSPDHSTTRCVGTVVAHSAASLTIAAAAGTVEAQVGDVVVRRASAAVAAAGRGVAR
ncbi:hypothetical protein A2cp1_2138 [Anaeromyxobacter dehalogenans 2CP-1]|uniref:Uncharacterized protein n=1 Tax=Anaeromyxobacter dehalogenans (strain ATCC BAA-258 / DSM 21875 / 2CP-1) TaxID=455488 RepID=B8J972_ANAD2|nr:hypothetical protein [Anaeromyxobacter dehalogenans]ACL65478.1 hypothetical protein A2cp1_2138 [Anaeromyxobacter dehalogenans 2CP-1]